MNKHTKGPWYVSTGRWDQRRYIYAAEKVRDAAGDEWDPLIAVTDDDEPLVNWEANARLIAAAPELLAALITVADRDVTYWSEDGEVRSNFGSHQKAMDAFRLAIAAIKKATGESE